MKIVLRFGIGSLAQERGQLKLPTSIDDRSSKCFRISAFDKVLNLDFAE